MPHNETTGFACILMGARTSSVHMDRIESTPEHETIEYREIQMNRPKRFSDVDAPIAIVISLVLVPGTMVIQG